jgi:hypothetical protein
MVSIDIRDIYLEISIDRYLYQDMYIIDIYIKISTLKCEYD